MLGGMQKFHGQSGFFEATMNVAVMKKVRGQYFQLDVLEKLGLPVTESYAHASPRSMPNAPTNALPSTPTGHFATTSAMPNIRGKCAHGRQRYYCKDCGGGSICEHGRRRFKCKECVGSEICGHGRQRYKWIADPDIDGADVDANRREELTTEGTKRKRAPPTKVPCEHYY